MFDKIKWIFIYAITTLVYIQFVVFMCNKLPPNVKYVDIVDTSQTTNTGYDNSTSFIRQAENANSRLASEPANAFRAKVVKPTTSTLCRNGIEYRLTGNFMSAENLNWILNQMHYMHEVSCTNSRCKSPVHYYSQSYIQNNIGNLDMRHDCSGLVSWVFRQYGYLNNTYSSRQFYAMYDKFEEINPNTRQTGDIYVKCGHVGMYIAEADVPGFIYVLDGGSCTSFSFLVNGRLPIKRVDNLCTNEWKWMRMKGY